MLPLPRPSAGRGKGYIVYEVPQFVLKAVKKFPRRGVHPYYYDTLPMLLVGVGESRIHFALHHIPLYAMKNRIGASDVDKGT